MLVLGMSLVMLLLASTAQPSGPRVQGRAAVAVLQSATITEARWRDARRRTERRVRDEVRGTVRLRIIDLE